jgi:hypothetical protein
MAREDASSMEATENGDPDSCGSLLLAGREVLPWTTPRAAGRPRAQRFEGARRESDHRMGVMRCISDHREHACGALAGDPFWPEREPSQARGRLALCDAVVTAGVEAVRSRRLSNPKPSRSRLQINYPSGWDGESCTTTITSRVGRVGVWGQISRGFKSGVVVCRTESPERLPPWLTTQSGALLTETANGPSIGFLPVGTCLQPRSGLPIARSPRCCRARQLIVRSAAAVREAGQAGVPMCRGQLDSTDAAAAWQEVAYLVDLQQLPTGECSPASGVPFRLRSSLTQRQPSLRNFRAEKEPSW